MQNIYYSVAGILCLIVHLIINFDILFGRKKQDPRYKKSYKHLLVCVCAFFGADILWGVVAETQNNDFLFFATIIFFFALSAVVVFWCRFVADYLMIGNRRKILYKLMSTFMCILVLVLVVRNFFARVFFWIDESGVYRTGYGRVLTLLTQAFIFFLFTLRAVYRTVISKGKIKTRFATIASFGATMTIAGIIQLFTPVLPIYSMGLLIGCCAIHAFVVEGEKEEILEMLSIQKERAEQSNEAKTTFLFSMSHDIRTPMNAIMGYTELIKKVPGNPEKTEEYLNKISTAEENLLGLINNVLEMARIEKGAVEPNERPYNLYNDLEKTITIFMGLAQEKNITLTGHDEIYHPYIMEDDKLHSQIAVNIVSNAIKYTKPGGKVDVYIKQIAADTPGECSVEFKVVDNGIGMTKEFLEHAFENFAREKNSTDSKIPGVGLGLGIVKKLIDQMGGMINIESEKDVGTTVTVVTHHRLCNKDDVVETVEVKDIKNKKFKGRRILLVEDNELNCEIAKGILTELGIEVEEAQNGARACELLIERGGGYFDMVLMDIQMPLMNGYDATRAIRKFADTSLSDIPIVAMTANAFEEDQKNARAAGMNGHVAKPINIGLLIAELERQLKVEDD